MARSQETFTKREREKQRAKKQEEKKEKMKERKANGKGDLGSMMAYLDENGNLTDTPPDPKKVKTFRQEDIQISVPKQEDRLPDEPKRGTVSFFNTQKGFGFIVDDETRERIFVHVNDLTTSIQENDKVTFFVQKGPKGLNATDVALVK